MHSTRRFLRDVSDWWIHNVDDYWSEVLIPSLLIGIAAGAAVYAIIEATK